MAAAVSAAEIRDQLPTTGKIESRLRKLETIDTSIVSTQAGDYRLSWLVPLIDQDRAARRPIRQLAHDVDELVDTHGTTLRDEPGIGPIAAATLLVEVGDPFRFARGSKCTRWSGTVAVAVSSGAADGPPVRHHLDFGGNRRINSVLNIGSVTQQRDRDAARTYIDRKTTEGKPHGKPAALTSDHLANRAIRRMWATNDAERPARRSRLDKGASDSPLYVGRSCVRPRNDTGGPSTSCSRSARRRAPGDANATRSWSRVPRRRGRRAGGTGSGRRAPLDVAGCSAALTSPADPPLRARLASGCRPGRSPCGSGP